uniref:DNA-directed RNA polymerase subunit beta'' n=1 Tax=Trichomanes trollii TaxID=1481379 RepID=A0A410YEM2_9MONI|nr:RNA polymerase b''-subunit [Trichomanes trollii]QAV57649.1 RNA polymerase b''-subunit [Trichomanes trollii]
MTDRVELLFYNKIMDRTAIKQLISRLTIHFGIAYTTNILDQIKVLGFQQATKASISLGIDDLLTVPSKGWLVQDIERQGYISEQYHRYGGLHAVERLRQSIETWYATSEWLRQEMNPNFTMTDPTNPVHMMSFSGARGSTSQVHQLVGMRGLMSDPRGQVIDLPIRNNLREGLSLTEYIISRYGARKGVVDTAVRTSDAGYLTRRLVEVVQHIVVRGRDCETARSIAVNLIEARRVSIRTISQKRLIGRVLADNVYSEMRCIATRNQDISNELASNLITTMQPIYVRSPLTCRSIFWICQLCYGWSLAYHDLVELGEAVGIIAGQSIGEPGTQSTLRTFHTGGVFTGDIAEHVRIPFSGIIRFDERLVYATRTRHGHPAWLCEDELPISIKSQNDTHRFIVPAQSLLMIRNNQYAESKQIIAEIRSKEFPLKERIKKHIYPNLDGEIYWSRIECYLSQQINSNIRIASNTGHIWVLSGSFIGSEITYPLSYEDQDRISVRYYSDTKKTKQGFQRIRRKDLKATSNHSELFQKARRGFQTNKRFSLNSSSSLASTLSCSNLKIERDKRNINCSLSRQTQERYKTRSSMHFDLLLPNYRISTQKEILATSENLEYRTNVSGILRYGTIRVEPIGKKQLVFNGERLHSFRPWYRVIKEGNFFLIPEEVYITYEPSSSVLVANNSIVEAGTQITSNIISQVSGSVQIKKIQRSIEIRLLPGYVYYPEKMITMSEHGDALIPPGNLILGGFKSDDWTYVQLIASSKRKRKISVSIRPAIEYNISKDSLVQIAPLCNVPKTWECLRVQAFPYIFYRDGEEVRVRNNTSIQLLQTCLVIDWPEYYPLGKAYMSFTSIKINNILSTFLQINLSTPSNPLFKQGNNKSLRRSILNQEQFPNLYSEKNKSLVKDQGVIYLVATQNRSRLMLSSFNLFRNLFSCLNFHSCKEDCDRVDRDATSHGSKENSLFEKRHLRDLCLNSRYRFLNKNASIVKKRLTRSRELDLFRIKGRDRALGLLGDLQGISQLLLPSSLIMSISQVSFLKDLDAKRDSMYIFKHRNRYFIDENESIFNYPRRIFLRRCLSKQVSLLSDSYKSLSLGVLTSEKIRLTKSSACSQSGQIIAIDKEYFVIRAAKPYLATQGATVHKDHGDTIGNGDTLITLLYDRLRSGDIIQGLPKVEHLLESRSTGFVSTRIEDIMKRWNRSITRLIGNLWSQFPSVGTSMEHCQSVLIDQIRKIYGFQGVQVSDRHLEIIIRQITSKVITLEEGITNVFLPGELIELSQAQRMNRVLKKSILYEPIVLGMTRASLNTTSFISEASFQETTRVLAKAALRGRIDWLKGLKENIILGDMVPIGTGNNEVICQLNVEKQKTFYLTLQNLNMFYQEMKNVFPDSGEKLGSHRILMIHQRLKKPKSPVIGNIADSIVTESFQSMSINNTE